MATVVPVCREYYNCTGTGTGTGAGAGTVQRYCCNACATNATFFLWQGGSTEDSLRRLGASEVLDRREDAASRSRTQVRVARTGMREYIPLLPANANLAAKMRTHVL